jgi:hypothetical protein
VGHQFAPGLCPSESQPGQFRLECTCAASFACINIHAISAGEAAWEVIMKIRRLLWLICGAAGTLAPMLAANGLTASPEIQKLDISVGRWVFHGKTLKTVSRKPGLWTWNEDCNWSSNHLYLECTFSNVWSGKAVESLVVDTYNNTDHSYWHYELYASGEAGKNPFISRMEIEGNTWIEYGREAVPGKTVGERIVYQWKSPSRVSVAIETSKDGMHWEAVDQGEGVKQQ